MLVSHLFDAEKHRAVEQRVVELINSHPNFLSAETATSPRAAGDAIQAVIAEHFQELLGSFCKDYYPSFPRRAMADLAFSDRDGFYYAVDVKTHRLGTDFDQAVFATRVHFVPIEFLDWSCLTSTP